MSNAIVVPDTFKGPVSAVFQGQQAADDLSGGITGGYGLLKYRGKVWSIQHNGNVMNLMRDDGDGPRGSVDVVIAKANPQLSKTWYADGWDENNNNPPDCASANGITPDQGVPKKQSEVCAMCPRNAWGSAPGGGKGKACGDHRRLAVVPLADLRNETFGGPLLLRCPAASLQDMAAFDARYKAMGYPYFTMGLKISFDPQESFPKFVFQAIRPLNDAEAAIVLELRNSPLTARVINESVAAVAPAIASPASPAFLEPPPANAVPPQQVAVQPGPVVAAAPAPAPAPPAVQQPATVQPVAQPTAVNGTGAVAGGGAQAGGFGPVAAATAAQPAAVQTPAVVQPAPAVAAQAVARPAQQMTGFGAVAADPAASPAQQAPAGPAPQAQPAPGVVSAFEGSIDERLNALLASQ